MSALSDSIEAFIKSLIAEDEGRVEVQRNELAQHFRCAPSQINYVLATRFSPERGYVIESRRGGAGYIRILRVDLHNRQDLLEVLERHVGTQIGANEAFGVIGRLEEQKLVSRREGMLMRAAVSNRAISLPVTAKDHLRAGILRSMILAIMANKGE